MLPIIVARLRRNRDSGTYVIALPLIIGVQLVVRITPDNADALWAVARGALPYRVRGHCRCKIESQTDILADVPTPGVLPDQADVALQESRLRSRSSDTKCIASHRLPARRRSHRSDTSRCRACRIHIGRSAGASG